MASLCTGSVIRDYFLRGQLPPNGLVCSTNENLFPAPGNATEAATWMSEDVLDDEDRRLLQNIKALGEEMEPFLTRGRR
jgi:hypothetical protein